MAQGIQSKTDVAHTLGGICPFTIARSLVGWTRTYLPTYVPTGFRTTHPPGTKTTACELKQSRGLRYRMSLERCPDRCKNYRYTMLAREYCVPLVLGKNPFPILQCWKILKCWMLLENRIQNKRETSEAWSAILCFCFQTDLKKKKILRSTYSCYFFIFNNF